MKKPVIICVDDELAIINNLEIQLQQSLGDEYEIETASDGKEALELIKELIADGYEIPLVISDHIMPKMSGDELLKRIHEISPKTIKVLLTGQADLAAVVNAINYAKLYRYISKPWQIEDLSLTVKKAVNSYFQDKKIAEQNIKLQQMNQVLEQLNHSQAALISQLQENKNRLQQFLEAIPIGVAVVDSQGKTDYINQTAKEILDQSIDFGITIEQISQVYPVYKAGTSENYPVHESPIIRALHGENVKVDDIEIHKPEKIIPLEISATPIYDSEGNIVYALKTIQDITERKRAEAERQKLIEELFALNYNLEKALESESKLANAAQRFVPNEFLSLLGHTSLVDVKLGDQVQQEMSVLFSDIRNFTFLSESMTPEDNFKFINAYLSRMESAIAENNGFIDKYIGDGIMALFGGSTDDAVKAGIAMIKRLNEFNANRKRPDRPPIHIGIGINTGSLMLGTVGGKNRMDSTVISDAVNLASRVEQLTKYYGVSMLITQQTFLRLNEPLYAIRPIGQVPVKGKSKLVLVYEVFEADPLDIKEGKLATSQIFTKGLHAYKLHKFQEAEQLFAECLQKNPMDKVSKIYWHRCQANLPENYYIKDNLTEH
ncbi:MAG: adenylate/guanylate cyclase domain-containing protein [Nostocaceae cyanobacterium]|nr:adenylate/guanylate cyclase domain-containing protein [Nostocaceae cyanobacterium]